MRTYDFSDGDSNPGSYYITNDEDIVETLRDAEACGGWAIAKLIVAEMYPGSLDEAKGIAFRKWQEAR